jgi:hypothetical protein
MNKTKIILAILISISLITLFRSFNDTFLIVKKVYASDSYGNDINYIEIYQYNGSSWNLVTNFTSSGGSERIHDNWQTRFLVNIKLNSTLATSTSEAISYTRVYMNISTVWTNVELNNTSCSLNGDFYWLLEEGNWTTSLPSLGVTYSCSVNYQAYY